MPQPSPMPPSRPRLRALEPMPFEHEGQALVAWHDPAGIAAPIQVPMPVAMLMSMFDGSRGLDEIQAEWRQTAGEELPLDFLHRFIGELDGFLLLESPRFDAARGAAVEAFRAQGVRPPAHCPGGYPAEPAACRRMLEGILARAETQPNGSPAGLVAPHIDLDRGGDCYAEAYAALAGSTADLYIVLGIAHSSCCQPEPPPPAILTRLDFGTPLGTVATDRAFVDRLARRIVDLSHDDPFRDELVHRGEHSLEFQMLFLQHLHGGRRFRAVPVLLGSLHPYYAIPMCVESREGLGPFLTALREQIADYRGEICIIAGADLAHLGPRFGHPRPVDADWVARNEIADLRALGALGEQGAGAFFRQIGAEGNSRNVCSVANLYALRALLPDARFRLLRYQAAFDPRQTVSFAAAVLDRR